MVYLNLALQEREAESTFRSRRAAHGVQSLVGLAEKKNQSPTFGLTQFSADLEKLIFFIFQ